MPVSAHTLELLMAAGLSGQALLDVVASIDADHQPKERSSAAIRQQRYRDRQKAANVTNNVTRNATPVTPAADHSLSEESTPPSPPTGAQTPQGVRPSRKRPDWLDPLVALIGEELTGEVVDHRKAMKAPLTAGPAKHLADSLRKCRDPVAAAKLMMLRGWKSVKPQWVDNDDRGQTSHNQSRASGGDRMFAALAESIAGEPGRETLGPSEDPGGGGPERGPATSHSGTVVELRPGEHGWSMGAEREGDRGAHGHVSGDRWR